MQHAVQLHRAGKLTEAEQIYRQVLSQQPRNPGVLNLLGVLACQAGRHDLAIEMIRQAIAIYPHSPDFHLNLGNALYNSGLLADATSENRQAIALKPRYAQAHSNLGNCLHGLGQLDDAIAAYRQALAIDPGLPQTLDNLGAALRDRGRPAEAIVAHRQSLALRPDSAKCHHHLGNALRDQTLMDEAVAAYEQAIRLDPQNATFHNDRAIALRERGSLDDALLGFRRAVELHPDYSDAQNNLAIVLRDQGLIEQAVAASRRAVELSPASAAFHSNLILFMHYDPRFDPHALLAECRNWGRRHGDPLRNEIAPHPNDRAPGRRLRIGYVSPDFRVHPVGRFMIPLFAVHDPTQFEVFAYAQVARDDEVTNRLRSLCPHWRHTVGLSDAQLAEQIREDRIDILVDLAAHSGCSRLPVFALKPAPVQATYLAYASTTGLEAIDYRITDAYLDPPGESDEFYSEKSVRIESYWCYQPCVENLLETDPPSAATGQITFGCLNNFCKVSPAAMRAWCQILQTVPRSRLLLHAYPGSHRERARQFLVEAAIDPDRLVFAEKLPLADYMRQYERIDICLDPYPYAGGTTTCDALWMGVPVITLAGKTGVSRGGVSILSNAGLPELIAANVQEYIRIAADLAADSDRTKSLRSTLRARLRSSPVMDAPRFARQIEAAFRQMWLNWCAQSF